MPLRGPHPNRDFQPKRVHTWSHSPVHESRPECPPTDRRRNRRFRSHGGILLSCEKGEACDGQCGWTLRVWCSVGDADTQGHTLHDPLDVTHL